MVDARPNVSVIIPTFNRAELLERALRSVSHQSYIDWECLVVDDGSSDDIGHVVESFGDSRIRCLRHSENKGGAAARNTGIRAARGRYVAFLDSDDEWVEDKLAKQIACFAQSSFRPVLVSCGVASYQEGDDTLPVTIQMPKVRGKVDLFRRWYTGLEHISFIVCTETPGWPIFFDESMPALQDWEILSRLTRLGNVDYVPEVLLRRYYQLERVHQPQKVATAWRKIVRKYGVELAQDRGLKARFHARTAVAEKRSGNVRGMLGELASSIRCQPTDMRHYVRLALALLGLNWWYAPPRATEWLRKSR